MISTFEIYGDSRFLLGDGGLIIMDDISFRRLPSVGADRLEGPPTHTLTQNFPNPFALETTILYELSRASDVTLTVYDVLRRAVSVRLEGLRTSGEHHPAVELPDLPRGVYFYRLQAGDFVQTRQMIVAR